MSDDRIADLLERAAALAAEGAVVPPVARVKAIAAQRTARARMMAVAAVTVLLLGAGALLVTTDAMTGSPGDAVPPSTLAATSPHVARAVTVITGSSPPPPALLAESASVRWQQAATTDQSERSPRRDKI